MNAYDSDRSARDRPLGLVEARESSDGVSGDVKMAFEELAGQVAGEPLLGPSQLELVSGMSRRLEHGPPLSAEDRATYLDQVEILRVPRSRDQFDAGEGR
jgi:hypothetical protein